MSGLEVLSGDSAMMLTVEDYAAHAATWRKNGQRVAVRTVWRWLDEGRLPQAVKLEDGRRLIPSDARPGPVVPTQDLEHTAAHLTIGPEGVTSSSPLWWTVDDLVALWAPHLTRRSVLRVLRVGELRGYRRGGQAGQAWLVPLGEVRRLAGDV